jgi:Flp pilus assembly protein TadG
MRLKRHGRASARRGVTIVEGAIVLAVTLLFVLGGLDLGLALTRYNSLCEAACRAARCVAVRGATATELGPQGPVTMEFTADSSNVIAGSFRYVLATMQPADVRAVVEWPDGDNQPDDRVRVTLEYQHRPVLPLFLGYGDVNLQATSVMSVAH